MKKYVKSFGESLNESNVPGIPFYDFVDKLTNAYVFKLNGRVLHGDDVMEEDTGLYTFDVTDEITFTEEENHVVAEGRPGLFMLNVTWNGEPMVAKISFPSEKRKEEYAQRWS